MTPSTDLPEILRRCLAGEAAAAGSAVGSGEAAELVGLAGELESVFGLLRRPEEPMPESVGRYRPIRLLGAGGFSRVYLAFDPDLHRLVALKLLTSQQGRVQNRREWMSTEGRSIAQLTHEGVIRVFDFGEQQGSSWLAMEYVRGPSLRDVLAQMQDPSREAEEDARRAARNLRSLAARCRFVARIARALEACHAAGIVHRDVKPENILLDGDCPRLIDFGLAHLEEDDERSVQVTEELLGTLPYLAPEQVAGRRTGADPLTDQFALGVVLYELLTLTHPFRGSSLSQTVSAVSQADSPSPRSFDPSIPLDLERICLHALEQRPQDRYPSMAALASDLEAFVEHRAISLVPPTPWRSLLRAFRRHRRRAVMLLALVALLVVLWLVGERAQRQRFVAAIEARRQSLDQTSTANEFHALISWLKEQQEQADRLDAAELLPWPRQELDQLWRELAPRLWQRISELQAAERAALDREHPPHERLRDLASEWRPVRWHLHWSCPFELPQPARVRLDPAGKLERLEHGSCPPLRSPVPAIPDPRLEPGYYRLTLDGGARQTQFFVHADDIELRPRCGQPPDWLAALMRPVPATDLSRTSSCAHTVPAFELSLRPITWAQLRAVLTERECDELIQVHVGQAPSDDEPAVVPWSYAAAFCDRVGARLPTVIELRAAALAGALPEVAQGWSHWASPSSLDENEVTAFPPEAAAPEVGDPGEWMIQYAAGGFPARVCLRVARSRP